MARRRSGFKRRGGAGSAPPPGPTPAGFVGRTGTQLTLNGQPFTFTGHNLYNAGAGSFTGANADYLGCGYPIGSNGQLSGMLNSMGAGNKVIRTWFWQKQATRGPAGGRVRDWRGLDYVVQQCKAHGKYLMPAIVGNNDHGNSCAAGSAIDAAWVTGGYKTEIAGAGQFYGDTVPLWTWIQEVVDRYKNDPTILAWQLWNEAVPDMHQGATTAQIKAQVDEIAAKIKEISPNHLVAPGYMNSVSESLRAAWRTIHSGPNVDIGDHHDYGGWDLGYNQPYGWRNPKVTAQLQDAKAANVAFFIGEVGYNRNAGLQARADWFKEQWQYWRSQGCAGYLPWEYNVDPHYTEFTIDTNDPLHAALASA